MRPYAPNSPRAAARIVALVLLSDGHLSRQELSTLERIGASGQLGLAPDELLDVIREFCDDVLCTVHQSWSHACQVDEATLAALAADVTEGPLRRHVLRLCQTAVDADGHIADGEACALRALVAHWGLEHEMLAPSGLH